MVIKIHGSPISTATIRVVAAVHEKELEYEFVPVDMKSGAHKQPDFLALNVSSSYLMRHVVGTETFGLLITEILSREEVDLRREFGP